MKQNGPNKTSPPCIFSVSTVQKAFGGGKRRYMGRKLMLFMTKDRKVASGGFSTWVGGNDLESGCGR